MLTGCQRDFLFLLMLVLLKYKTYSMDAVVDINDADSWARDGMSSCILSTRGNFGAFRVGMICFTYSC